MKVSTYFALMAEFGTGHVPVTELGKKFFGYDEQKAKAVASSNKFPFPVFRAGGQKSPWMADISEVAKYLDEVKEKAKKEFNLTH
jgi:hypothetical protein